MSLYRRAFWTSRHHAWLGILTLGLGFLTAEPLGLLAGATAYVIGLIFLPDAAFFRRWVDARETATHDAVLSAQLAAFEHQQQQLLANLSAARRTRYQQLLALCREIESATGTSDVASTHSPSPASAPPAADGGTRRQKLDELAFTFLRMLALEQSLEVYLETERKEQVPALVKSLDAETQTLAAEIDSLRKSSPTAATLAGKERLLTSRLERLASLQQRLERIEQAQTNHDLLRSEQERLVEQVKLIRADAIASRNADTLTSRIDLSIEHLAATNKWMSELATFKDLTAEMPPLGARPSPTATVPPALKSPNPPQSSAHS